jgi:phage nucleotide-binding protein
MKIKKTNEVESNRLFALIVGSSGVGKTSLAKTLPHEETLILSAESGLLSIRDASIDVIEINNYQDMLDAFAFLSKGTKYKNVFIDSLTEFGEIIFHEIKPSYTKAQTFGLYDEYSTKMIRLLKAFRDLVKYNIYFTCLDKMVEKNLTETSIAIDLIQKSLSKKVPPLFDEVFYMNIAEKEDGSKVRYLSTNNSVIDFAKDRSGKLEVYEQPDLGNIYNKIFNKGVNK